LLDKSLVRREADRAGEARFGMLETIREYAQEQRAARGETAALAARHAAYYRDLAEQAMPHLLGQDQARWLDRLDAEQANLRAALAWARQAGEWVVLARTARALWRFWWLRGALEEGQAWLAAALAGGTDLPGTIRGDALYAAGALAHLQGDYAQAHRYYAEGLRLYQALDDPVGTADLLISLANNASAQGEYAAARTHLEESLALTQALGDEYRISAVLVNLGTNAYYTGDYARAGALYEQCLPHYRALGDLHSIALTLHNLGEVHYYQGEHGRARAQAEESLALFRELGAVDGMGHALASLGWITLEQGEVAAAGMHFREALALFQRHGFQIPVAQCLSALGTVALAQEQPARAARLLGAADQALSTLGTPFEPPVQARHAQAVGAAQARLAPAAFQAAWTVGQVQPLAATVAQALGRAAEDLDGTAPAS
jgi:tetratricopeptide (TPR) repeat protein